MTDNTSSIVADLATELRTIGESVGTAMQLTDTIAQTLTSSRTEPVACGKHAVTSLKGGWQRQPTLRFL